MPTPPAMPLVECRHEPDRAHTGAILLCTLTTLYVQQATHSVEEEQHYCELAQRLLEGVDAATRAAVVAQLASYPAAPLAIVERLACDLAPFKTPAHVARPSVSPIHATPPAEPAQTMGTRDDDTTGPAELSALFCAATSAERRRILRNLEFASACPPNLRLADPAAIALLDTLALQRRREEFAALLARLLRISVAHGRSIICDGGGECIVVAAKALVTPVEVMQRVLLFLDPAIGHSVQRVYDLVALHQEMSMQAARVMVSIWQAAHPTAPRPARCAPGHWRNAARLFRGAISLARPSPLAIPAQRECQIRSSS